MSENKLVGHYFCICNEAFNKKSQIRKHVKVCEHVQRKCVQCVICPVKKKYLQLSISSSDTQPVNGHQDRYKNQAIERFKCGCEKHFKSKGGYYRHIKKCKLRPEQQIVAGKTKCNEPGCLLTFKYIRDLRQHLNEKHKIQFNVEDRKFNRYPDFLRWKENYEIETRSCFYHRKTETRNGRKVEYWYCNRSGIYQSASQGNRRRKLKAQGILKINNNCTSSITLTINVNEGTVQAIIYHTHYGHEAELVHLRIPKSDKQEIASKLLQGVKIEDILLSYKEDKTSNQTERKHLIKRRDILNISKKYNVNIILPKLGTPKKKKQIELTQETINPDINKVLSLNSNENKQRHIVASKLSSLIVNPIHENVWKISMGNNLISNNQEDIYHVTKNNAMCNCKAYCHCCNICNHSYSCTCSDFLSKNIICEHVHLVVLFQKTTQQSYQFGQNIEQSFYNIPDHTAYTQHLPESLSSPKPVESVCLNGDFQENNDYTIDQNIAFENLKSIKTRIENLILHTLKQVNKCNNCDLLEDVERQISNITYNLTTDIIKNEKKANETIITPEKNIEVYYVI